MRASARARARARARIFVGCGWGGSCRVRDDGESCDMGQRGFSWSVVSAAAAAAAAECVVTLTVGCY